MRFYCTGVTGGVVVAQVVTLEEVLGTDSLWHVALAAYIVLVLLCSIPYPWYPESPKYLFIVQNNRDLARQGKHVTLSAFLYFLNFDQQFFLFDFRVKTNARQQRIGSNQ